MLVETFPDIQTPSGTMDTFVARPAQGGPFPLVVLLMDIWGLREELFEITRRVARQGYFAALPNLFYRHGKLRFGRRNADGKMVSFAALPPDIREHMRAYAHQVVREPVREDLAALLEAAKAWPVSDGPAGSIGFCLGGRAAFYAGQEFPDRFRANASLHGTLLVTDKPFSGHLKVAAMRGEVYCGYGGRDDQASPAVMDTLKELFAQNPAVVYRSNLHPGAEHGYSMPDRDVHDAAATEQDWQEIFAMLRRQLG
ncbi:MAG: dienelactone hydrolase family protein [Pseudolabrys sp.]